MLPVFLMGVGAMSVRLLRRALGEKFGIGIGALIIAVSCASRIRLDTSLGLLATAAGAGIGISIVQALAPGFIKRSLPANTGRAIGLFSTGIVAGAAFAAASAAGLAESFGWTFALASWGMPALLAIVLWSFASRSAASEKTLAPLSPEIKAPSDGDPGRRPRRPAQAGRSARARANRKIAASDQVAVMMLSDCYACSSAISAAMSLAAGRARASGAPCPAHCAP